MDGCRAGSRTCHDIEVNSKRAFDSSSGTQVDPKQNFEGLDGIIALSTVLVPSLPSKLETYGSKPNTLEIWNQPWIAKSVHAVHCTSLPYILKLGPKPQTIASDCETQESQRKNLGNFHQVSTRRPTINNHKQRPTEPPKVKPPPNKKKTVCSTLANRPASFESRHRHQLYVQRLPCNGLQGLSALTTRKARRMLC